jgi:hypothetical protein
MAAGVREVPDLLLSLPSDKRRSARGTNAPACPSALDRVNIDDRLIALSEAEGDVIQSEVGHREARAV